MRVPVRALLTRSKSRGTLPLPFAPITIGSIPVASPRQWRSRRRLPRDIEILDYRPESDGLSALRPDQILQRARRDCIDLIHVETCGPQAIVALFVGVATRTSGRWLDVLQTWRRRRCAGSISNILSSKCERLLAASSAARNQLTNAGIDRSRIATVAHWCRCRAVFAVETIAVSSGAVAGVGLAPGRRLRRRDDGTERLAAFDCHSRPGCADRIRCTA